MSSSNSRARAVAAISAAMERLPKSSPKNRLSICACRPTSTFSSAVSSANNPPFWKVRRAPRADISCGVSCLISSPRNRMLPESATTLPDTALNSDVLPAPFGPIRAQISPFSTRNDTPLTATNPPNRTVTSRSSSSVASATVVALDERRMQPRQQARQATWQEQNDQNDQQAEDQLLEPRKADERLWRGRDDGCSDDGSRKTAETTHHDDGELQDQLGQVERHRRKMADRDREHRSTDADNGTTPGEGQDDIAVGGNSHGRRGDFVVLDRQEGAAEAGPQQPVGHRDDQHDQHQKDVEPAAIAIERPAKQAGSGYRHSHRAAGQRFPSYIGPAHQLTKRKCHDGKVEQTHAAQRRDAGNGARDATHDRCRNDRQPPRHAE